MFEIQSDRFHDIEKLMLINKDTGEYLSVIPSVGGNIQELVLRKGSVFYSIIAGDKQADSLKGISENAYRGAKLSPFPNRIDKGNYTFSSNVYSINKNDSGIHALHGFIWNKSFEVIIKEASQSFALLVLEYKYQNNDVGYPFQYVIRIEYKLDYDGFSCLTEIENRSDGSIPIGDGWHPYFRFGKKINELKLMLPSTKCIETSTDLIPTGKYIEYNRFVTASYIGDTVLDNCFELDPVDGVIETVLTDAENDVHIVLWQETNAKGYNYVHIYTPTDRESIAIEPSSCGPDAFNNGNGLIILEPNERIHFTFGIDLE